MTNIKRKNKESTVKTTNINVKTISIILPKDQIKFVQKPCAERTSFGGYDYEKSNSGIFLAK